jgi:hypothetical protein
VRAALRMGCLLGVVIALLSGCMLDTFSGPDQLLTNEYAYWNPDDPSAVESRRWEMTSGSLFLRDEMAWSGVPDDVEPDATSSNGTNSAVFRMVSRRSDIGHAEVSFDLIHHGFVSTPSTPALPTDGVHVFLRYQSEQELYYASVNRRDGLIVVKKKVPGGSENEGTYYTLATAEQPFTFGELQAVRTTIRTTPTGTVVIRILRPDGTTALRAEDTGIGGPVITAPGRVGIRGDNSEFSFDDFKVAEK